MKTVVKKLQTTNVTLKSLLFQDPIVIPKDLFKERAEVNALTKFYLNLNKCGRPTARSATKSLPDLVDLLSRKVVFVEPECLKVSLLFGLLSENPHLWVGTPRSPTVGVCTTQNSTPRKRRKLS
jgi:hypothetical protein